MSEIIKVIVKSPTGQTTEHQVEKSYSLKQLKGTIQKEVGVSALSFFRVNGKQLMNENANLDACDIGNDSIVQLHDGIQIFIRLPNTQTISLLVDRRDTIEMVKNLIYLKKDNLRTEAMELRFCGHLLKDDWFVSAYGIKGGNTLLLSLIPVVTSIRLTVSSASDSIALTVEPSVKVKVATELIAAKLTHKLSQFEMIDIFFDGRLLDPEMTLQQCNLKNDSVLLVRRRYQMGKSALSSKS